VTKLTVGTLQATSTSISMPAGHGFSSPGGIVQAIYARTDATNSYAAPVSGDGTTILDLGVSIVPKLSNSLILLRFMINGEVHYDTVFTLHMNGRIITEAGYQGYNNQAGNARWSGVSSPPYDANDQNSTQFQNFIQYYIPAGGTNPRTYAPAIRSASGTAYTLYLNRTIGSTGADSYEVAISTAVAMEIAQ